jgi:hypothetical protein
MCRNFLFMTCTAEPLFNGLKYVERIPACASFIMLQHELLGMNIQLLYVTRFDKIYSTNYSM